MESEERRFNALDFLLDYSKGTLWWVKDRVWKEADDSFVVKRKGHPGLSICNQKMRGLHSIVPMLVGTSAKHNGHGNVVVKDVFPPELRNQNNTTYFSVYRPKSIRFDEFGSSKGIVANADKPRITVAEERQLDSFLKSIGNMGV